MTEKVQTKVYLPPALKAHLDADSRTNSEAVEAALWAEYGGRDLSALERRIEEKKRRISTVESEKNERVRELKQERNQLESLQDRYERSQESHEVLMREAVEKLRGTPADPSNQAIQKWAEDTSMSPSEFATRLKEWRNQE